VQIIADLLRVDLEEHRASDEEMCSYNAKERCDDE
jgi:hypothetical protein